MAGRAFHPDGSTMQLDNLFSDGKPQPKPVAPPFDILVSLLETLEKDTVIFLRDTLSRVPDAHRHIGAVWQTAGIECYAALFCELQRIRKQVENDTPHLHRLQVHYR